MVVVVVRYKTTATARWALLFIVSAFFNDTITVAVWTGFHVPSATIMTIKSAGMTIGEIRGRSKPTHEKQDDDDDQDDANDTYATVTKAVAVATEAAAEATKQENDEDDNEDES